MKSDNSGLDRLFLVIRRQDYRDIALFFYQWLMHAPITTNYGLQWRPLCSRIGTADDASIVITFPDRLFDKAITRHLWEALFAVLRIISTLRH